MKLIPRDYQVEALEAIQQGLQQANRISVVMACGTGKTMVSLWAAQQAQAKTIVVFMPSLALIKQTIDRWMVENTWMSYGFMAVCSDKTMGNDEMVVRPEDCDFVVTTNKEDITKFLKLDVTNLTKVIFCTYQSSPLLHGFEFDLGIFDEAHKTAHKSELAFRYALKDENVAIKKRIFMTATPKHYSFSKLNDLRKQHLEFSMDNEEVYGKIVYRLDFTDAIKRNIICDYKVVISVINNNIIKDELVNNAYIQSGDKELNLMMTAHAISLKQAFNKFPIKRCITFHRTIKESQEFIKSASTIFDGHVHEDLQHINGAMNSHERAGIIKQFLVSQNALLSNARCLSEGVDIPEIDLVGFLSPKKSKIDIIQAVGRVMRKCAGKEFGYILLPIYIDANQKIEDVLETTEYKYIFSILNSLREYDTTLNHELSILQGQEREQFVRDGKNKIVFTNSSVDQYALSKAIEVHIAESFHDEWDDMFEKLKEYKEKNGGFKFKNPDRCAEDEKKLRAWVNYYRVSFKNNVIDATKIERLKSIGFVFDEFKDAWTTNFNLLKIELETNGFSGVNSNNPVISAWLANQRENLHKNKLDKKQKQLLLELCQTDERAASYISGENYTDFVFNKKYDQLVDYYNKHGHCKVSKDDDKTLYAWTLNRSDYKESMSQHQIDKLNAIGFEWHVNFKDRWHIKFQQLKEYKEKNGTLNFYNTDPDGLSTWAMHQRTSYKKNKLSKEREELLDSIGVFYDRWGRKLQKNKA